MDFIQSAILGLVQGLTEFIPVSSTGHLIIVRKLLGLPLEGSLSFDAILQLATGLAVLVYFWKDIWNLIKTFFDLVIQGISRLSQKKVQVQVLGFPPLLRNKCRPDHSPDQFSDSARLLLAIIVGSIPAVVLGLVLQKYMDTIFRGTTVVGVTLILGAILFYFAERKYSQKEISEKSLERLGTPLSGKDLSEISEGNISIKKSLIIGFYQCLALVPGMSRSGSTISGGLLSGLNREVAVRFSFLLSLPIIFGSGLKKVFDLYQTGALAQVESSLFLASLFAFISGFLAIHFLIKFLRNHSLNYFGIYRIILAVVILIWL